MVSVRDVYQMINGDPFILTKMLQIGGYRIVCDDVGGMTIGNLRYTHQGYVRKTKAFLVGMPDGSVCTVESLLASSGNTGETPAELIAAFDREHPPAEDDNEAPQFTLSKKPL